MNHHTVDGMLPEKRPGRRKGTKNVDIPVTDKQIKVYNRRYVRRLRKAHTKVMKATNMLVLSICFTGGGLCQAQFVAPQGFEDIAEYFSQSRFYQEFETYFNSRISQMNSGDDISQRYGEFVSQEQEPVAELKFPEYKAKPDSRVYTWKESRPEFKCRDEARKYLTNWSSFLFDGNAGYKDPTKKPHWWPGCLPWGDAGEVVYIPWCPIKSLPSDALHALCFWMKQYGPKVYWHRQMGHGAFSLDDIPDRDGESDMQSGTDDSSDDEAEDAASIFAQHMFSDEPIDETRMRDTDDIGNTHFEENVDESPSCDATVINGTVCRVSVTRYFESSAAGRINASFIPIVEEQTPSSAAGRINATVIPIVEEQTPSPFSTGHHVNGSLELSAPQEAGDIEECIPGQVWAGETDLQIGPRNDHEYLDRNVESLILDNSTNSRIEDAIDPVQIGKKVDSYNRNAKKIENKGKENKGNRRTHKVVDNDIGSEGVNSQPAAVSLRKRAKIDFARLNSHGWDANVIRN